MATIDVDDDVYRRLEFAARMAGTTVGELVARLVDGSTGVPARPSGNDADGVSPIYAIYEGHRVDGRFDRRTHRVDLTSGPLAGTAYRTPSGAAIAVVRHYKPTVNPNRNGWAFWTVHDGSGRLLQSLRAD